MDEPLDLPTAEDLRRAARELRPWSRTRFVRHSVLNGLAYKLEALADQMDRARNEDINEVEKLLSYIEERCDAAEDEDYPIVSTSQVRSWIDALRDVLKVGKA